MHIVGNKIWAEKCGLKHIELLARPTIKKNTVTDKGPWHPHESPWEKIFFEELLKKGIKTIPQYPVSGRRLDLALIKSELFSSKESGLKLDIEIDSDGFHRNPDGSRKIDDTWRDIYLMGLGWKVKRYWVYNLKDNMEKCVSEIEEIWRENG
jgi:very-short-patch-repair endonuclease